MRPASPFRSRATASAAPLALLAGLAACGDDRVQEAPDPPPVTVPPAVCKFGEVAGRVCAPDNATGIAGASIWADGEDCHGDPVRASAVSDGDGRFILKGVPPGSRTVNVETGSFKSEQPVDVAEEARAAIPDDALCFERRQLKMAVVTGRGDRIQAALDSLGLEYDLYGGTIDTYATQGYKLLSSATALAAYDVVFINCAAAVDRGVAHVGRGVAEALRAYVAGGGSLYASDWAAVFVALGFPADVDFLTVDGDPIADPFDTDALMGYAPQTVEARVLDPDLERALGDDRVTIAYPYGSGATSIHWGLIGDMGDHVEPLIVGDVLTCPGDPSVSCYDQAGFKAFRIPLAVAFSPPTEGAGRVIYTSFHNIAQPTADVAKILNALIFKL